MLKKMTVFVLTALVIGLGLVSFAPMQTYAAINPTQQACEALGTASGGTCDAAAGTDVNKTLKLGINVFSMIVGFAAIVMIIVGGLKYIISNGDSGSINSAKNTILYAIIGLVVVALAQVVVRFVLEKATVVQCKPPTVLQADGTCK